MKRKFLQCSSLVNPNAVKRETIDGVEHIIVSSMTLPSDIVMNGIMYPGNEIEKSFEGLNRTLAPVEHPVNAQGQFVSASDPEAIHNFHAGAFNDNAEKVGDRVKVDKIINVQEALKSERGRRLLDRINELETSSDPRPIHTSTGIFLEIEELGKPQTNAQGQEYSLVARNMVFDHDAILLDSVGAAQPHQGVGMAVNRDGKQVEVETVDMSKKTTETNAVKAARNLPLAASDHTWSKGQADRRVRAEIDAEDEPNATYARYHLWFDADDAENFGAYKLPFVDIIDGEAHAVPSALRNAAARLDQTEGPSDAEKETIRGIIDGYLERIRANQTGLSYTNILEQLRPQAKQAISHEWLWIEDLFDDVAIIETDMGYYKASYSVDGTTARLTGIPVAVDRVISYQPKTNAKGDVMRDIIINALKAVGKWEDGMSDEDAIAAYNALMTANNADAGDTGKGEEGGTAEGDGDANAQAIANALKPLQDQISTLQGQLNANADAEKEGLIKAIVNSKSFPGMDEDALKALPGETLKKMAANCGHGHGLPINNHNDGGQSDSIATTMPE